MDTLTSYKCLASFHRSLPYIPFLFWCVNLSKAKQTNLKEMCLGCQSIKSHTDVKFIVFITSKTYMVLYKEMFLKRSRRRDYINFLM